ncbi:uncharacterized protein LOC121809062 [Salvia splendens]|uniref:uncharacterized protein LOC121809062 n=1 Tax=Salvia splendens TaxID=180675 RepID=UPI001C25B69F|nr:uncharacterized protein LOC121809062 [Salvia splendens]
MEPFTQPNPKFYSKLLRLEFKGVNVSGKIWVFVKEGSSFEVVVDSEQAFHGLLTMNTLARPLAITVVYAKCARADRYPLWSKLREIGENLNGRPWMIGGDFNTILHPRDRSESDSNRQTEMLDFAEVIKDCRLMALGFDGAPYTWARNDLFERLDRMLVSEQWFTMFESSRITNLPRVASDHGPVLMRFKIVALTAQGKAFRFQNMWLRHEGFKETVATSWSQPMEAEGLLYLQIKLSTLKKTLKDWNKNVFGNLHANLSEAETEVAAAQTAFEMDPSTPNRANIKKHIARYILLLKMEEDLWRQKASVRWLKEGDINTKFYQSWVKQKRARLRIHEIQVGDWVIKEESEIKESATVFFQDLLAPPVPDMIEPNLDLIHQLPPTTDLMGLVATPSAEEVKQATWDISADSAPCPDRYTAAFFHKCWDIVGQDIIEAVAQFFNGLFSRGVLHQPWLWGGTRI